MSGDRYPKWKYSSKAPACIVDDEAAEKALKGKWYDSPADIPGAEDVVPPTAREKLEETAKGLDIPVDPAWSDEQLTEAIFRKTKV